MADKDLVDLPDDFERLLRQELSIEPSPEFAARVRQRVASRTERHGGGRDGSRPSARLRRLRHWRPRSLSRRSRGGRTGPVLPAPPAVRVASVEQPRATPQHSLSAAPVTTAGSATARRPSPRQQTARPEVSTVATDLPVVIVDDRQRAALATLFRMMDQGRVSGDSFAATIPVSLDPIVDQVGAITVAPVVVSAIAPGGVLPNNSER